MLFESYKIQQYSNTYDTAYNQCKIIRKWRCYKIKILERNKVTEDQNRKNKNRIDMQMLFII